MYPSYSVCVRMASFLFHTAVKLMEWNLGMRLCVAECGNVYMILRMELIKKFVISLHYRVN